MMHGQTKIKLIPTFLKVYSAINNGDNYKYVTCQLLHYCEELKS